MIFQMNNMNEGVGKINIYCALDYTTMLTSIDGDIDNLVSVQDRIKKDYNDLVWGKEYKLDYLREGLEKEYELICSLKNNLNLLFGISESNIQGFKILPFDRSIRNSRVFKFLFALDLKCDWDSGYYEIKPPFNLDKSGLEFDFLKKILMDKHKEYFGRYRNMSLESNMWKIPNCVPCNDLINGLRSELY